MNALRLSVVTAVVVTLTTPFVASAAPSDATSTCTQPTRSAFERGIEEHAARGMRPFIGYVRRAPLLYHLTVEEAVAWVDRERERQNACLRASAENAAD